MAINWMGRRSWSQKRIAAEKRHDRRQLTSGAPGEETHPDLALIGGGPAHVVDDPHLHLLVASGSGRNPATAAGAAASVEAIGVGGGAKAGAGEEGDEELDLD